MGVFVYCSHGDWNMVQTYEGGCRSVSGLPQLLPQLEGILFPIMQRMVSTEGQDVFEDVLEIVAYFTFFSPEVRPVSFA